MTPSETLDPVALAAAFAAADEASPTGRAYAPSVNAAIQVYLATHADAAVPVSVEGYCSDCECVGPITNGRCHCGSGRIVPLIPATPSPAPDAGTAQSVLDEVRETLEAARLFVAGVGGIHPISPTDQHAAYDRICASLTRIKGYDAAIQHPVVGVKVKALTWTLDPNKLPRWECNSIAGFYFVGRYFNNPKGLKGAWWQSPGGHRFSADTLEAAKAAAQADYERRVLSCLSHPAQGWREDAVERAVRAWAYEEYYLAGGGVGSWHEKLSFNKPKDGRLDIRSIAPLYVAPPEGGVAQDLLAAIKQLMPSNLGSLPATMPDSATLPLDVTFGELRQAIAAIAKAEGRSDA